MKRKRTRLCCLLLAALLLWQTVPSVSAFGNCSTWAQQELQEVAEIGLFPESLNDADMTLPITRQEMCEMAVLAYKKLTAREVTAKKTTYFKDTDNADICLAYEIGIVSGYQDSTFRPNAQLTRMELLQMLYNLFVSVGWTEDEIQELLDSFDDSNRVGSWAKDATKIMLEISVTKGAGNNLLNPTGTTTVEEALSMFLRAYYYWRDWQASFTAETGENTVAPVISETHFYTKVSAWAQESVDMMEALGFIPVCLNGADLTRKITREEMCEIAALTYTFMTGDNHTPNKNYFKDTTNANVNFAYENGIVAGYTDGSFRPKNSITRQEFFQITCNLLSAAGWEKYDPTYELFQRYVDSSGIGSWARTAAKVMIELDIVKGNGSGCLLPNSTTSREQAAILFYRAFRYINLWYSEHPLDPDTYPGTTHIVNPTAEALVALAREQLGKRYVYGNEGPDSFDCSGLVWWLYRQFGYSLYRTADRQWYNGVEVSKENLLPGDLVYFSSSAGGAYIGHIGVYIGEGNFLHAANTRSGVIITSLSNSWYASRFYGCRRIIY